MNLNLRHLEVFLCVAELRSFTAAGRALRLTPSALSRTVHQLEAVLETRLFERDTHAVSLSAAGTEFVGLAKRLLEECDRTVRGFKQFLVSQRNRVSIMAPPSVAAAILSPVLCKFRSEYPQIEVSVRESATPEIFERMGSDAVDLALAGSVPPSADFTVRNLLSDQVHLVCLASHPLARQAEVSWKEVAAYPFIAKTPNTLLRTFTDAAFLQAGVRPSHVQEVSSNLAIPVLLGYGVTAVFGLYVPCAKLPTLVSRPLVDPTMTRQIHLLTKVKAPPSAAARTFTTFLLREIRSERIAEPFRSFAHCSATDTSAGQPLGPRACW